jgi:hypothetical protein
MLTTGSSCSTMIGCCDSEAEPGRLTECALWWFENEPFWTMYIYWYYSKIVTFSYFYIWFSGEYYKTNSKEEKKSTIEKEKEKQTELITNRTQRQPSSCKEEEEEYEQVQNGSRW